MKRILIVDPLSYKGHENYNYGIIRAIRLHYDYDIVVNQPLYEKLQKNGIPKEKFRYVYPASWNITELSKRMCKLFYHIAFRFYFLRVLLKTWKMMKDYDAILITCIDVYSFCIISCIFKSKTCLVVDHGIGSIADNYLYKLSWNLVSQGVELIVLENFIKEMVISRLKFRNIYVVRHPLPIIPVQKVTHTDNCICTHLIFAPSASNDDEFLSQLLQMKIPENVSIVAKSHSLKYESKNLSLYRDYLSREEYQKLFAEADYILLAYTSNFNYRVSSVMFEALSMCKNVLILNNNTLHFYKDIFKENVFVFSTPDEMLSFIVNNTKRLDGINSSLSLYSDDMLGKTFCSIIG